MFYCLICPNGTSGAGYATDAALRRHIRETHGQYLQSEFRLKTEAIGGGYTEIAKWFNELSMATDNEMEPEDYRSARRCPSCGCLLWLKGDCVNNPLAWHHKGNCSDKPELSAKVAS